jgi:DNA-binding MarR family transcriptional regulator
MVSKNNLKDNGENINKSHRLLASNSITYLNNKGYSTTPPDRFYTEKEEVTLRFYQTPKALFNNPGYEGLSLGSKLMYSILRDRLDMSIKNNWKDEKGFIYLVFSIEELSKLLEINKETVSTYKKQLVKYGLIIDKRLGQGKSNMIYVLKPEIKEFLNTENPSSRIRKNKLQEYGKSDTNDTYIKKTDLNNVNTAKSVEVVENSTEEIRKVIAETNENINDIRRKIKKSLKENEKPNLIKPQDSRKVKNNYQKDWNLKNNKPENNTESKRHRLEEDESLAKEISEVLDDDHSLGAFRVIVDRIPKQRIRIFLSIIKDTYLNGRIRKSRGAMFISLARDYARENNINLNFK